MRIGQVFPTEYESQLTTKVNLITQLLAPYSTPEIEVFSSAPSHYRQRAEFRIWHDGDDIYHAMFDPETKQKVRIDYFPVACELIADFMPLLLSKIQYNHQLRYKLYQVDYLATLSGELLVSLIYKRQLDQMWQDAAQQLVSDLLPELSVKIIGRARKQKIVLTDDFVTENVTVTKNTLAYQQIEGSFTQPNAGVNQKMLNWAADIGSQLSGDLLELYCGNGNFALALAPYFNQVVATEISRTSIKSAQYNIALNNINNVQVLQMSAEDVSKSLENGTALKQIELAGMALNTVLVDPPRAGLDPDTVNLVSRFNDIIYISCNPETLAMNLESLDTTHRIVKTALFDQFPYSHHVETGVWLQKR
ncbi:MAG: tRNA (uridine(54)-C5)-methyltransferase TrmA [Rheinheimera sp.]|uniref:tRNA (uridine(54)-C5)-methyltransferase TrmA n=1 Tax=Arsukibacterium sp. UBA3155 TaxID=1946058 RepID=UPI000C917AC5|nr:tRNA (uridine(54)-C5)-methyltransferase TrmA [Arsukibacterium sp. UBA3155]MAD76554.1 tRNA (uridine(54)-C5)-methyltransferase TrmA [Rheinheimera sp.]|tara:strand:- start:206915 stop:208003 length:1089 start_codon:yes stop_codon:yes gene_type:complete